MGKKEPHIINDLYIEFNKQIRKAIERKKPEFKNKFAYVSKFEITGDGNIYIEFSTSFLLFKKEAIILYLSDVINPITK
ncbi:MAG: hypothetical protein IT232_08620 [Flavobacteriales bacterium]|nr:hypothetical protein [Flavobacteriales bacterium]